MTVDNFQIIFNLMTTIIQYLPDLKTALDTNNIERTLEILRYINPLASNILVIFGELGFENSLEIFRPLIESLGGLYEAASRNPPVVFNDDNVILVEGIKNVLSMLKEQLFRGGPYVVVNPDANINMPDMRLALAIFIFAVVGFAIS
jgi:hypothetical protein